MNERNTQSTRKETKFKERRREEKRGEGGKKDIKNLYLVNLEKQNKRRRRHEDAYTNTPRLYYYEDQRQVSKDWRNRQDSGCFHTRHDATRKESSSSSRTPSKNLELSPTKPIFVPSSKFASHEFQDRGAKKTKKKMMMMKRYPCSRKQARGDHESL